MRIIRVGVTGGRNYTDANKACYVLDRCFGVLQSRMFLVVGCASGLDSIARNWAFNTLKPDMWKKYEADWTALGKAAGPERNKRMAESGLDLLIAFPGGRGTANMIQQVKDLNERSLFKIKILEIT